VSATTATHDREPEVPLAAAARRFSDFAQRWVPDAFVFALVATIVVWVCGVAALSRKQGLGGATLTVAQAWGTGVWDLLAFTMQMAMVIVSGFVLASAPAVARLIAAMARVPKTARGAVAFVAFFAMVTSWFNWGFSLIFSAMLAKEVARVHARVDYRAVCAAAFLGLGSIWAQGLSGSAALQMATGKALSPEVRAIVAGRDGRIVDGVIPLTHTIFLWQSLLSVAIELLVVTLVAFAIAPRSGKSAADLNIALGPSLADTAERHDSSADDDAETRGLEHRAGLGFAIVAGASVAVTTMLVRGARAGSVASALSLDALNLVFLTLGFLLHRTPARLMRAVRAATPSVWSVLLQFPFYAGISAVVVKSGLHEVLARAMVGASSPASFPALVATYSIVLGVFVPSGGTKWVIEAPYVMAAAHAHHVHLGWMVAVYDLGEALANLIQPFWMLPVLSIFGLRARDVMGFTATVFLVLLPLVLLLVTVLGATLRYPL
jgi:short-chain fatty acids transporter